MRDLAVYLFPMILAFAVPVTSGVVSYEARPLAEGPVCVIQVDAYTSDDEAIDALADCLVDRDR